MPISYLRNEAVVVAARMPGCAPCSKHFDAIRRAGAPIPDGWTLWLVSPVGAVRGMTKALSADQRDINAPSLHASQPRISRRGGRAGIGRAKK